MQKQDKNLIWHIQGGLGKNIAATALIGDIKKKYSDRKLILVVSHPNTLQLEFFIMIFNLMILLYVFLKR